MRGTINYILEKGADADFQSFASLLHPPGSWLRSGYRPILRVSRTSGHSIAIFSVPFAESAQCQNSTVFGTISRERPLANAQRIHHAPHYARERGHRNNLLHLSFGCTFSKLVSAALFCGAIDDRAIHVNATSTHTRLFDAVWDVESRSMTDGVGTGNA